jgi:F-type H+-transporting ATPase subunit alpha
MDAVTKMTLDKGKKNSELLIQPQYHPMPVEKQIAIIYCGTQGLLSDVPVEKVRAFEKAFLDIIQVKYQKEVLDKLKAGILDDEVAGIIRKTAMETAKDFAN